VCLVLFYAALLHPNALNHADNFIEANPLSTPTHIVPEWYFLPFYAILRAVPNKLLGVCAMIAALLVLFALPLLASASAPFGDERADNLLKTFFFCFNFLFY